MTYSTYKQLFDDLLESSNPPPPYDNPAYLDYTKLNRSRMNRWDKQLVLNDQLMRKIKAITEPQHWVIITEPWCGDAAQILPFLIQMTSLSDLITFELQLRDSAPFLINDYLTGSAKSIPKLIVRNAAGEDLFTWGPRPAGAQQLMNDMQANNLDFEVVKVNLQNWYNKDKGQSICQELTALL